MLPDIVKVRFPRLHELMVEKIRQAFDTIDQVYDATAFILDRKGITGNQRLLYRAYVQELWRIFADGINKAAISTAEAIANKYWFYNADPELLREIGMLFGFEPFTLTRSAVESGIDKSISARVETIETKASIVGLEPYVLYLDHPDPDIVILSADGDDVLFMLDSEVVPDEAQILFNRTALSFPRLQISKIAFRAISTEATVRYLGMARVM